MKNTDKQKFLKGFTMVEVLISVTIVAIGFTGVLSLAVQLIRAASYSANRVIAVNLAQEALEIVRGVRDTNWVEGEEWNTGLDATMSGNVNWNSVAISNMNDALYINSSNRYSHSSTDGTITFFKRHIEITDAVDAESGDVPYKNVKAVVEWSERGRNYSEILEDYLYPWE